MAGKVKGVSQDDDLNEEAHRLLKEALESGKLTLKSGTIMALDGKSMIALVEWICSRMPKKPKLVTQVEDLPVQETQ